MIEIRGPKENNKKWKFRNFFLKIRTQRYTAEFKNDVISHVGYFIEKLEVHTNINYVPNKVLGNRSVTPWSTLYHRSDAFTTSVWDYQGEC